jgi:hypothetical protein
VDHSADGLPARMLRAERAILKPVPLAHGAPRGTALGLVDARCGRNGPTRASGCFPHEKQSLPLRSGLPCSIPLRLLPPLHRPTHRGESRRERFPRAQGSPESRGANPRTPARRAPTTPRSTVRGISRAFPPPRHTAPTGFDAVHSVRVKPTRGVGRVSRRGSEGRRLRARAAASSAVGFVASSASRLDQPRGDDEPQVDPARVARVRAQELTLVRRGRTVGCVPPSLFESDPIGCRSDGEQVGTESAETPGAAPLLRVHGDLVGQRRQEGVALGCSAGATSKPRGP